MVERRGEEEKHGFLGMEWKIVKIENRNLGGIILRVSRRLNNR